MKPKNTIMLLLVLAALGAAYWATGFLKQQKTQQIQEAKQLFQFDGAAVTAIELKRVDGPLCRGERQAEGSWKIIQPNPTIQAMPLVWDRMANALVQLRNERTIADAPADLKAYGLEEPRLTFSATVASGDPIKLVFGAPEPTQTSRFARLNDGPVFLVNEKQFFELDRDLDLLRYRFLVDDRNAALLRIEFARIWTGREEKPVGMETAPEPGTESKRIIVVRDTPESPWRMIAPFECAADQEAVEALAKEVQFGMGDDYVDTPEDLADYGLVPANALLIVTDSAKGTPQTIHFGDADKSGKGRLFAKRDDKDAVFTVDGTLLGKLPRVPEAFRERRLLTQQAKDIVRAEYVSTVSSFAIIRGDDGAWKVEGADANDFTQERLGNFFTRLKQLAVEQFIENADAVALGLGDPDVSVKLTLKDEAEPREIRLKATPNDASVFYARQDTGEIGVLTADRAKDIMVSLDSFRSLALMKFEKRDATKITFSFESKPYVFEKAHDLWLVRQPEGRRLTNQTDADTILNALMKLNASSNAPVEGVLPEMLGLENPVLSITVTTTGPDGEETTHGALNVGRTIPSQTSERYCTLAGKEGVFMVKQDVVDKVRDALHGVVADITPAAQQGTPAAQ